MVVLGIIAVPAVDACATDSRGLVTCLRDMVDRRFNLPGEVPQPPRSPSAQTSPVTAPISVHPAPTASAPIAAAEPAPPDPVAVAEPPPELPKPPAAQGGPYIPPAPERVADLRPEPVESTPAMPPPAWSPPTATPTPKPVETVPFAPTADVFSDIKAPLPAPVATQPEAVTTLPPTAPQPEEQTAPVAKPAPQPSMAPVPSEPKPSVLATTSEPTEGTPSAATPYELPPPPVFPSLLQSAELPAPPVAPAAPAPPKPAETTMAAGPEIPPIQPQPKVTAPVALAPTIDAIELEGARSFVSGSGPAGAVMRLFADDEMIGESPVEEGRWLVETGPLLTSPKRELKVEAVDPDTGKSLGQTVITVEIELEPDTTEPDAPRSAPPVAPAPPQPQEVPQPAAPVTEAPESDTPEPSSAQPEPEEPQADAPAPPTVDPIPPDQPASESQPEPVAEPEPDPEPLPTLEPTKPERESASVSILGAPGASSSIKMLAPREPAILAQFDPPRPRGEQSVTVLKLVPFGDPVNGRFTGGKAIIRRGDTLWTLAHRYYGAGIHYRTIFEANRDQISRPSRIFPGQIFDLPLVTND